MRVLTALALLAAAPASAEIVDVGPSGMEVKRVVSIEAPPEKIWAALIEPSRWWSSDHTFSGSAANMTLDARAGGCWCEALPGGGGVVHMTIGYLAPPKTLVMRGSLGPLFNLAADGGMQWELTESGDATNVTMVFRAGGYVRDGFDKLAAAVDAVLGQQTANLKKHLETAQ